MKGNIMRSSRLLLHLFCLSSLTVGAGPRQAMTVTGPLNREQVSIRGVHVLAMVTTSDGVMYAGGRDTHDPRTPDQPNPFGLGSVFMTSHDHGAHWATRVNREPPPGYVAHYPPWTDHTRWPSNFSVYQITVDPHRSSTIYAAGGLPFSRGSRTRPYLLLRSTDAGRTWGELLVLRVNLNTSPPLVTNIMVTPANRQDLSYRYTSKALALAIDPQDPRRLYAGTDGLGVLRSANGGVTWQYNPRSPSVAAHTAESLVIDPQRPMTVYALIQDTTIATLYRSDDGGSAWQQVWHGGWTNSLLLERGVLSVAHRDGVYASSDRGAHWRRALSLQTIPGFATQTPFGPAGMLVQARHDRRTGGWQAVVVISSRTTVDQGIYLTTDQGATWRRQSIGAGQALTLALRDMEYGYERLWLDDTTQPLTLYTARDPDGLYRWRAPR